MNDIGKPERETQRRVIALFRDELGYRFLGDPYFLSGTAVPDWLSVVDRKVRVRSRTAAEFVGADDPQVAAIARGIVQHHHDDAWFHNSRAFAELNLQFTVAIRDILPPDEGFRPSFLGHILVELLLDSALIEDNPSLLDAYYETLESVDASSIADAVGHVAGCDLSVLGLFIPAFIHERFLYDYSDDTTLLYRLNNVMQRVRLPQIQQALCGFFPEARANVRGRLAELLAGESENEPA